MRVLITLLKPLSFLPALLMMYMIYSFSGQTGEISGELSYKVSYQIVKAENILLDKNMDEGQMAARADGIHYYVRKAAHMTEYFLLAVAVSLPLYVYGVRGIWLLILAGGFCVAFACLDEYHQSFVGGRSPAVKDVFIDSVGVFVGVILVQMFCWSTLHSPGRRKKYKRKKRR
ncbi:MAG TPA: VanZ family protein [Candidatus Blautia avistercoris]|mgnify:FL=1|uniref:VanZ family protein n=1 Tax=Blautia sp. An249 TaxID=1965603 RepID=UPI000B3850D0|nr:VanZ family protein [Blautia sp. An249]OUO78913.1 VanZ family protein [Blautia sp. An249]HIY18618.1 VanZ family protein [Candidatus Blautia avistercoris]